MDIAAGAIDDGSGETAPVRSALVRFVANFISCEGAIPICRAVASAGQHESDQMSLLERCRPATNGRARRPQTCHGASSKAKKPFRCVFGVPGAGPAIGRCLRFAPDGTIDETGSTAQRSDPLVEGSSRTWPRRGRAINRRGPTAEDSETRTHTRPTDRGRAARRRATWLSQHEDHRHRSRGRGRERPLRQLLQG